VEHVASGSRFKLFIPRQNVVIWFALSGVKIPSKTTDAASIAVFGDKAKDIVKNWILHRNVEIEVESIGGDNFFGSLLADSLLADGRENVAVKLLQDGLARYITTKIPSRFSEQLAQAVKVAQEAKLNLWEKWEEKRPNDRKEFKQESVNVKLTDLTSVSSFWFQRVPDADADTVAAGMAEFNGENAAEVKNPVEKGVYAGLFSHDNAWHRVKVLSRASTDGEYRVLFLDYGNTDTIAIKNLRELPEDLKAIFGCAQKGKLTGVKATRASKPHGALARHELQQKVWEKTVSANLQAKFEGKVYMTLFDEEGNSVNQYLIEAGFARLSNPKKGPLELSTVVEEMDQYQQAAIDKRSGLWVDGYVSSEDEEEDQPKRKGVNGQQKDTRRGKR